MNAALAVFRKDLRTLFYSPIACGVSGGFFLFSLYFFFSFLRTYNLKLAQYAQLPVKEGSLQPDLQQWVLEPYFQTIVFLFLLSIPFVTMRSFSEEFRSRSFELLAITPASSASLFFGKLFACFALVALFVSTALFPVVLLWCSVEVPGQSLVSGALALLLAGVAFASLGVSLSSRSENQTLSGLFTFLVLGAIYFLHSYAESVPVVSELLRAASPVLHTEAMVRGEFSLRGVVYFLSFVFAGTFLGTASLGSRRSSRQEVA